MAAAVADAGQGIIFRQKGHLEDGFIGPMSDGSESRRLTGELFFHFHAQRTAQIDVVAAGMIFFTGQLRVVSNGIVELKSLGFMGFQSFLQIFEGIHFLKKLLLSNDKHI